MKLMKLKCRGTSFAQAPSKAIEGAINKYSFSYLILYLYFLFFLVKISPKLYRLQASQNLDPPLETSKF